MKSGKGGGRDASTYRRNTLRRSSGKTFLIVTEGRVTEPNYFQALRSRLQLSAANVQVECPGDTDPKRLAEAAIRMRNKRKKDARNSTTLVGYDEVWIVLDTEDYNSGRRAQIDMAKSLPGIGDIQFAISTPCFEFWVALHHVYTMKGFADCYAVGQYLKNEHGIPYAKGQDFNSILDNIPDAIRHAERCRQQHLECNGSWNPSTGVDVLVRKLNAATRKHLQFELD